MNSNLFILSFQVSVYFLNFKNGSGKYEHIIYFSPHVRQILNRLKLCITSVTSKGILFHERPNEVRELGAPELN